MAAFTPQQFVEKWENTTLKERQSYQLHFMDVCRLVGHEPPSADGIDAYGENFAFEYGVKKDVGGQGFADVFYEGYFGMEYKAVGKYDNLDDAYRQLQQYRENLFNPPLLIVCDIANWEIHTNWPNTEKKVYAFTNRDILEPRVQRILHAVFEAPEQLHPHRNTEQVTIDAARVFNQIASNMRQWEAAPEQIAHFLTKLVFCLFAEDVGLLPAATSGKGVFSEIVEQTQQHPADFVHYTRQLFEAMRDGGKVMFRDIPFFNGLLFDDVQVETLSLEALAELERACNLDWSAVEPAIFGTLFERSLDPRKRAQLGAHYTSRDDILLIVEPVLMQPLRQEWEAIQLEAAPIREKLDSAFASGTRRSISNYSGQLGQLRERMLNRLRSVTVLDPACGSGNFLYVSLQLLMDIEKAVINHDLFTGLPLAFPEVHPRQMYGIEINPIAHDLASIVAWIGYIQWRQNNGYLTFTEPILEPLADNFLLMDAIMACDTDGNPIDPDWPSVNFIVSNPPFLGDKKMRGELGDEYVDELRNLFEGRVPGGADLVTYWFEKARAQIEQGKTERAGLLATNSIRDGANREVLRRIKETGDIFMAWSDRKWILDGAAVRVSMVGFDAGFESSRLLDGRVVEKINSDLTTSLDITLANVLRENQNLAFIGTQKGGAFEITEEQAKNLLAANSRNSDVVHPWRNATDITARARNMWIINFRDLPLGEAEKYHEPFQYVMQKVKPSRDTSRDIRSQEYWWQFQRARPAFYEAVEGLGKFIVTPRVAKHRNFVWVSSNVIPDSRLVAIASDSEYFFGVLCSRLHEVWSLATASWHGVGNDPTYNAQSCFETFPFPWPPSQENTASPAYHAISVAAKQLHEERNAWLNPPGLSGKALKGRTLTNLYNALNVYRGKEQIKIKPAAGDFAPRLDELHQTLDKAVCDAYGWDYAILDDEEEILRHLLALNLERAE